jgi:hypothetical protein
MPFTNSPVRGRPTSGGAKGLSASGYKLCGFNTINKQGGVNYGLRPLFKME